jgi:hypothetical protein
MAITDFFHYGSTRKLIVAFGTLFNNMEIHRRDGKIISIPLTYASKEKFYVTMKQNYALDRMSNMILPRMGFVITDIAYDFERKQSSIGKFQALNSDTDHKKMLLPVPYDLQLELSIYSRNIDDGLQILEQIIPMWKPSFNITINELDPMKVMRDIPIILDSISHEDTFESDVSDGFRMIRWDLNFTMKANFYGPVREQKIIKKVYVDYYTSTDGEYVDKTDERYYLEVDPLDSRQEDLWDYNEELISSHDSSNTVIMPVEIDIRGRETDGLIYVSDSCSWIIS